MPETSSLLLFLSASLLLILAPGPDIIFTLTQGITHGKKAGIFTALGLAAGNSLHTAGAALGLSIIFKTSMFAFITLKIIGVCYLLYLSWQAIKHRNDPVIFENDFSVSSNRSLFFKGFLMNMLNPKVAIFFLAFLPQFISSGKNNAAIQMVSLGIIFMIMVAVIFGTIGYFAGAFRTVLAKSKAAEYLNLSAAAIFILLSVKLAFSRQ